jgi:hypothetical protein
MKTQNIKVKVRSNYRDYKLIQLVGAVTVSHGSEFYRVGDFLTENVVEGLCNDSRFEVTVLARET